MALPVEQALKSTLKALPEDKFIETVKQGYGKAQQKTFLEGEKVSQKLKEFEGQQTMFQADTEKEIRLKEIKRDLYLKAVRLKKEREHISLIEQNKAKGISARDTIKDILSSEAGVGKAFSNIEGRTAAIETRISAKMHDVKDSLRTKWAGFVRDEELGNEIIRYIKDGQVKNKQLQDTVKKLADQWKESADTLKALRNKAGGRIGTLEDWVMPQSHDKLKMRKVGKEKWIADTINKLDRARIEREQNGKLEDILDKAYDNITAREIERVQGGTSVLAKKKEYDRVLHFKDGESIINYNKQYGNEDVFSIMDSHIRQQANEIAQLQILGPNPDATYENLKALARKDNMGTTEESLLDSLYNVSTGKVDGDDSVSLLDRFIAGLGGTFRAMQIASKLGTATISAIADISNILVGGGYRGLSGIRMFGKGLDTLLQEAVTIGKVGKNTELASRIGLISEFANASLTNNRYAEMGTGFMQRRAENVLRGSGLNAWTNSLRVSFGLELAANFAENFGKKFDDIPFSRMLEEYGITEKEWDIIRKSQPKQIEKAKFLDVNKLYDIDENLGYRISEMINQEVNAFVVAPNYRARVFTTWGAKKGTFKGEAARNMMLFRSFSISVTMMHLNRMGTMNTSSKVLYGMGVLTTGVVFGTISLWAHDIVTGKTPRDPNRLQMIPEALAKSGGLGIFGDYFLGEEKSRYGHSWASTLIGVPASTIEDISKTLYDTAEVAMGNKEPSKHIADTYNRAKSYIPGQNLWYTRLALEQTIGKAVSEMIDPDYHKKIRRRKKALRTRGQELIFE